MNIGHRQGLKARRHESLRHNTFGETSAKRGLA